MRKKKKRNTTARDKWTLAVIEEWRDTLGLRDWSITVKWFTPDNRGKDALCKTRPNYREATIWLDTNYPDERTPEHEELIIHELLHIAHDDIDTFVWDLVDTGDENHARLLLRRFDRQLEPFVTKMAGVLYRLKYGDVVQ